MYLMRLQKWNPVTLVGLCHSTPCKNALQGKEMYKKRKMVFLNGQKSWGDMFQFAVLFFVSLYLVYEHIFLVIGF